jgi:hypothetical protein
VRRDLRRTDHLDFLEVPESTYGVLRESVKMEELTEVVPRLIREVAAWVFANGGATGAPVAAYAPPPAVPIRFRPGYAGRAISCSLPVSTS